MATAERPTSGPPVRAHLLLPETDGSIVENFREAPQQAILTDCILPVLRRKHPDGQFAIGQDSGIYWKQTDPPLHGCKAPDWFYVPGVPPLLDGEYRRSYVLWEEKVPPAIALEFVSGDGSDEHDRTPWRGKFWVYEQQIKAPIYGIFVALTGALEVFQRVDGAYQPLAPNERGHFPIDILGVELGVWNGYHQNEVAPWLRWYDDQGELLPTGGERAAQERRRAEAERLRAEAEFYRAEAAARHAEEETRRAETEHQRAEEERRRAETEHQRAEAERRRAEAAGADVERERRRAEAAGADVERERRRAEALADRLRELGINPDEV